MDILHNVLIAGLSRTETDSKCISKWFLKTKFILLSAGVVRLSRAIEIEANVKTVL